MYKIEVIAKRNSIAQGTVRDSANQLRGLILDRGVKRTCFLVTRVGDHHFFIETASYELAQLIHRKLTPVCHVEPIDDGFGRRTIRVQA